MSCNGLLLSTIAVGIALAGRADAAISQHSAVAEHRVDAQLKVFGVARGTKGVAEVASKLDGTLRDIQQRSAEVTGSIAVSTLHAMNPAARFRLSAPLAIPEVLIDAVAVNNPQSLETELRNLGLRNVAMFANDVGGWLPISEIGTAATLTHLHFVRASMPRTRAAVATQGDFVQRSAAVRTSNPSLTGTGVTVGALSDSFNCYQTYANKPLPASGVDGYAANGFPATYATDQTTNALPSGVNVLEEGPCFGYYAPEQLPFSDEGRAILQIIHAVAPGATLAFHTASNSEADFANGIIALAQSGAKIIDDDVGYPDEPFFQDGIVAQAIDKVTASGVAYFSSAGNDARNAYDNLAPKFPMTSTSVPNTGEKLLNFDTTGATTATSMPITIPALYPGEFIFLILQWDQPYVTGAPGSGGATSSLDLCVTSASGTDQTTDIASYPNAVACTGANAAGVDPVQLLIIGNPADASAKTTAETVNVSIGLASGTAPPGRIKFVLAGDGAKVKFDSFATNGPTIQGHSAAAGAMTVGAAFFFATPACGTMPATLELFSSPGGDPILFDASGTRMATPIIRQKPDFVAPDGVNDTFLGHSLTDYGYSSDTLNSSTAACANDATYPNFFGTSAAAPHAAAAAALLLQANSALTPAAIRLALQSSALLMGTVVDDASGYGFIQADAALALLPPGAPSISVAPASITSGGSATLTWSSVNTTSCTASGSWTGPQGTSGSQKITPSTAGTNTYSLTCINPAGSAAASTTLTVTAPNSGGGGGNIDETMLIGLLALLTNNRRRIGLEQRH